MKRLLFYCALCFSLCSIGTNGFAQTGDRPIKEPIDCTPEEPRPAPAPRPCPAPRPEPRPMPCPEPNIGPTSTKIIATYDPVDPINPLIHSSKCWRCQNTGFKVPRPRWYDQEQLPPHCGTPVPYLPEEESNYYIIIR